VKRKRLVASIFVLWEEMADPPGEIRSSCRDQVAARNPRPICRTRDEATRDLPNFNCSQPQFAMRASDRRKVITSMMARVGARRSALAQDDQAASRRCSGADMGSGAGLNVWTPLSQ
jgi:hypothetical protein